MNQTDRSSAFACEDKWIVFAFFGAPAEATVYLFGLTKALIKKFVT